MVPENCESTAFLVLMSHSGVNVTKLLLVSLILEISEVC